MRQSPERSDMLAGAARQRSRVGRIGVFAIFLVALLVVWEGLKFIGGDPWRYFGWEWHPPLKIWFATDLFLPHVWSIAGALAGPAQRERSDSLGQFLVGAGLYTWREAAIGFAAGAVLGIGLASAFIHSGLLERAFVPYVIASQTIPIVALAPMIVFAFGQSVTSVVIIATYLTFFPVTIAMIRGLRSAQPQALELMRSYAASRWATYWKVRIPASLPYLFTALKISATASIVGAIIGEGPGGVPAGLGRAILNFNNQYITAPEKLWAAILVTALIGVSFFGVIRLVEHYALRGRPDAAVA
jgi:NitT/TauT family transport system permease protein